MKCPICSNDIPISATFCNYCGSKVTHVPTTGKSNSYTESPVSANDYSAGKTIVDFSGFDKSIKSKKTKNNKSRKKLIIILSSIAFLLTAFIVCSVVFFSDVPKPREHSSAALFVSDGNLYYYDSKSSEKILLSECGITEENAHLYQYNTISVSEDKKTIYYLDNLTKSDAYYKSGNLCYRPINDTKASPVLIDSNVSDYTVIDNRGYILYVKNGELYEYHTDSQSKRKTADITGLYNAEYIGNSKYVYRNKNNSLYLATFGEEPKHIADNIYSFYTMADTEYIYYTKYTEGAVQLNLGNYVEVDVTAEEYKNENGYTYEHITQELSSATFSPHTTSVYLYDGNTETQLATSGDYTYVSENLGYFVEYNYNFNEKIKLSQLESIYDVQNFITDNAIKNYYIMSGDKSYALNLDPKAILDGIKSDASEFVYIIPSQSAQADNSGSLYKISIENGTFSVPILIDENVYNAYYSISDEIIYTKNYNHETYCADYYRHGKLICENGIIAGISKQGNIASVEKVSYGNTAKTGTLSVCSDSDHSEITANAADASWTSKGNLYYAEPNTDGTCKLFKYSGNKTKLICDNVSVTDLGNIDTKQIAAVCADKVLYISGGDLYISDGGKGKKIAQNVNCFSSAGAMYLTIKNS